MQKVQSKRIAPFVCCYGNNAAILAAVYELVVMRIVAIIKTDPAIIEIIRIFSVWLYGIFSGFFSLTRDVIISIIIYGNSKATAAIASNVHPFIICTPFKQLQRQWQIVAACQMQRDKVVADNILRRFPLDNNFCFSLGC